jgi:hypothetical protein
MWGGKEPALAGNRGLGDRGKGKGGNRSDEQSTSCLLLTVPYCNYSTQMVRKRQGWAGLGWAGGVARQGW